MNLIWLEGDVTTGVTMEIYEAEQVSIQGDSHPCVLLILATFFNFFLQGPTDPDSKKKTATLLKPKSTMFITLYFTANWARTFGDGEKMQKQPKSWVSVSISIREFWYAQKLICRELQCLYTIICGLKVVFSVNTWQIFKSVYIHILSQHFSKSQSHRLVLLRTEPSWAFVADFTSRGICESVILSTDLYMIEYYRCEMWR